MKQDFVIIAEERCSNWDKPSGRCFGISPEVLRGEMGRVQPLDHCKLKDNESCRFFSMVVLPGIPKDPVDVGKEFRRERRRRKQRT